MDALLFIAAFALLCVLLLRRRPYQPVQMIAPTPAPMRRAAFAPNHKLDY